MLLIPSRIKILFFQRQTKIKNSQKEKKINSRYGVKNEKQKKCKQEIAINVTAIRLQTRDKWWKFISLSFNFFEFHFQRFWEGKNRKIIEIDNRENYVQVMLKCNRMRNDKFNVILEMFRIFLLDVKIYWKYFNYFCCVKF